MDDRAANAVLDALNAAVGALLDVDPDGKKKLAGLRGKVFCLDLSAPPVKLYLLPTEGGMEFRRSVEGVPDVTLSGSALAFAQLACAPGSGLAEGRVTLHGDAELGQTLQKILGQLDLDWEELLSRYIGDTPAHKLGNAARELAGWAEKSFVLSRENAADYFREENRILATNPAMEGFDATLNRTRADVDRLVQRVERIKRAVEAPPPPHPAPPRG